MPKKEKKIAEEKPLWLAMTTGIAAACCVTCLVFITYALLLTYTDITEKYLSLVVILTTIVSAAIAGFDASRGAKKKGWLWGMLSGALYCIVLFLMGIMLVNKFVMGSNIVSLFTISVTGGGVGGIIGINFK